MFSDKSKEEIFTIPNLLSLVRLALIPVYVTLYLGATRKIHYLLAGSVLAFSCMTDIADGIIARRFQMITQVGKVLDPLADKLTQFALILCLSARYTVLYPVLGLFLMKELFQFGALIFFARKGKALPGALVPGKICTSVLFVSLIMLVLFPDLPPVTVVWLTGIDGIFLLYSFIHYFLAYFGSRSCLRDISCD
jgi:cardiolipin synthase